MTTLELIDVAGSYGSVPVLHGVSLSIRGGEALGVIGANGAGKSSLLKAIAGWNITTTGRISLDGRDLAALACPDRVRSGVCMVPQGRELFPSMTVLENLTAAAYRYRRDTARFRRHLDTVRSLFPHIADRLDVACGVLSGGEQQMVAIGRALMTEPQVLLMDEPSTGLSPALVDVVMSRIQVLCERGLAVLVVEQAVDLLVESVGRIAVMKAGRVVEEQPSDQLDVAMVRQAYLGR